MSLFQVDNTVGWRGRDSFFKAQMAFFEDEDPG